MALEHAILVSLSERAASGSELTARFDTSFGYFWTATHQQIYRVLGRMEGDGWVTSEVQQQPDRPAKKVYAVTDLGRDALRDWIAEPTPADPVRMDLGVKLRGASYGDRAALLDDVRRHLDEHTKRLGLYEYMAARDFTDGMPANPRHRDIYLVLRGGLLMEQFWIAWLTEYLTAYETPDNSPNEEDPS